MYASEDVGNRLGTKAEVFMVQDKDEMRFLQRANTHADKARTQGQSEHLKNVQKSARKSLSLAFRTVRNPQNGPAGSCCGAYLLQMNFRAKTGPKKKKMGPDKTEVGRYLLH